MAIHYYDPAPQNRQPVLLLHGLGMDGSSWQLQFPCLIEAGFRPIAPDLPGFGRSPAGEEHWNIASMAAKVIAWLPEQFHQPLPVVGISMGGAIALQMALERSDLVGRLVLVNTFACLRPRRLRDLTYLLKRFLVAATRGSAAQADLVTFRLFPNPDQAEFRQTVRRLILESDPRVYRRAMLALAVFDVRRRLTALHTPTLVITSALDDTVSPEIQKELARGIPGARQVVIPNARHAVVADQAERFNAELLNFLQPAGSERAGVSA